MWQYKSGAYGSYLALKKILREKSRFFVNWNDIELLKEKFISLDSYIDKGSILYRARVIQLTDQDKIINTIPFIGFGKKDSFVPPPENYRLIPDGRMNPKYIRYLYISEDSDTAIYEVKPTISAWISVAKIRCNECLKICDLSMANTQGSTYENELLDMIIKDISSPTIQNDTEQYLSTQYISEYIKNLHFDGIKYKSSLNGGNNYTIFNFDLCEAISSDIYIVNSIKIESAQTRLMSIEQKAED